MARWKFTLAGKLSTLDKTNSANGWDDGTGFNLGDARFDEAEALAKDLLVSLGPWADTVSLADGSRHISYNPATGTFTTKY